MAENMREKSVIADNMHIDWDLPITMDDGIVLRADVYRPVAEGKYPVIFTYGPYCEGPALRGRVQRPVGEHDGQFPGDQGRDHEQVPVLGGGRSREVGARGYAIVRVDSRGAGRSPGYMDSCSPAGGQGHPRLRRVGGDAALEQRQGRACWASRTTP